MEFFATCPAGFEQSLARELEGLGTPQVRPLRGQVAFGGDLAHAYRVCLWSRLASRVICVLARVSATNADALYEGASQLAWEDHIPTTATYAIDAHGTNDQLRNTQFIALRVRDAINDRMMARTGTRPRATTTAPDLRLSVRVSRNRATLGIDLAGEPLFHRGYERTRPKGGGRDLRADYAAALLAAAGWNKDSTSSDVTLVVPFSGCGTLAVEAAGIAERQAPGLLRQRWGFEGWRGHDRPSWEKELSVAQERRRPSSARLLLSDFRPGFERNARGMLGSAGLSPHLVCSDQIEPAALQEAMFLACDLSWIDESALATKATALERLASMARSLPSGATATILAADGLTDLVLGEPTDTLPLFLGRDEASLRTYTDFTVDQAQVTLGQGSPAQVLVATSSQFAARLAKVYKQRKKWAAREDVTCYRVYDQDLPDYAVSIDLFCGIDGRGRWLQIYEYAPPRDIDPVKAQARLLDVVSLAPRILDVRPQETFVRTRTRARGGSQYADEARDQRPPRPGRGKPGAPALPPGGHLIDEGGLTFEVNFSTRLDCGIFLDHRETRSMLREMAKQTKGSKRFLNLFAYTGTGTCYAADGGAKFTTTVDLSRPSLDWARRNMERNGFTGREHEFVQADVLAWVSEQRRTKNRWDLVFCDVPTFSNSQRMRKASFDVQRDHAELLIGVSRLLTAEGTCVFSCNLRTFKIDEEALAKAGVVAEDITATTIPEDFSRNPRIHKCYLVRRTPRT